MPAVTRAAAKRAALQPPPARARSPSPPPRSPSPAHAAAGGKAPATPSTHAAVRYAPYDRTLRVTVDAARNKTTVRSAAFMRDIVRRSLGTHLFWRWLPEEKTWTTDVALNDAEVAALREAAAAHALPFALRRVRADGREEDVASHAAAALETAAATPAPPICRHHGRPCVLRTAGERAMPHNRGRRFWTDVPAVVVQRRPQRLHMGVGGWHAAFQQGVAGALQRLGRQALRVP
jgi:hypothetical protein